jgi:amidohydrolase
MEERLRRIADGIASAYRCSAETTVKYALPSVINDPKITSILRETAERLVGPDRVGEQAPMMISEDFGMYLEVIPGAFFFLGAGNSEKGTDFPHHSTRFNIDDDALPTGIALMSAFALRTLEKLEAYPNRG